MMVEEMKDRCWCLIHGNNYHMMRMVMAYKRSIQ